MRPAFKGLTRPWHAGVLCNRDVRFARLLMTLLKSEHNFFVGDNEPYDISDESDYTIPVHGERRGLHHVAIEIRQDLILGVNDQQEWVRDLRGCCRALISRSPLLRLDATSSIKEFEPPTQGLIDGAFSKIFLSR